MATKLFKSGLIAIACICALASCDNQTYNSDGRIASPKKTPATLVSDAVYVASLPDSRKVYRFNVATDVTREADHVYFVTGPDGTTGEITVNQTVPHGKTTVKETKVFINE